MSKFTLFLRNSDNYPFISWGIIVCYVIFMSYLFPRAWADTDQALSLVDTISAIVPMLRDIQKIPSYNHYWGVFYALFWVIAPILMALGFVTAFLLKGKRLEAFQDKSWYELSYLFVVSTAFSSFLFIFPDVGTRPWFNEMSSNVAVLLFTCWSLSTFHYFLGFSVGIIIVRLKSA